MTVRGEAALWGEVAAMDVEAAMGRKAAQDGVSFIVGRLQGLE